MGIFPDVEGIHERKEGERGSGIRGGTIYNSRPITRRRVKHACKIRVTNEIPRDSRPLIAWTRGTGSKLLQISSHGRDIWPLFAPAAAHYHRNRQIRNSVIPRVIIARPNKRPAWRKTTVQPVLKYPHIVFCLHPPLVRSNDLEGKKENVANAARNVLHL